MLNIRDAKYKGFTVYKTIGSCVDKLDNNITLIGGELNTFFGQNTVVSYANTFMEKNNNATSTETDIWSLHLEYNNRTNPKSQSVMALTTVDE